MTQTQTRPDSISGDAATAETIAAIERFNEAFNRHDVDAIMAAMTDDCVFESTGPAPDGPRFVGQDAVRAVWEDFFRSSPHAYFDVEEMFAAGDRCTIVKPIAGTEWCEAPHFQYQLSGRLHVVMADGTEFDMGPGVVSLLPSGHDAWVLGDEPVVLIDWHGATNYAK